MRIVLLLLLLAISKPFFPQDSLKAYVVFRTKHVIAYLDDKKITPSHDIIYLKKGMHQIKAWAPGYKLLEDSFMVEKNKTLYSRRLHHNGAYRVFVTKRWLKGVSTVVLPAFTVLYLQEANYRVNMWLSMKEDNTYFMNRDVERLNRAPDNPVCIANYLASRIRYVDSYRAYDRAKKNRIIGVSVLGVASLAYIVFSCTYKIKLKEKPLLSRLTPSIDPLGKQFCVRLQL